MRLSEFWRRMEVALGPAYSTSWASDHVVGGLGGRTVVQALANGVDAKVVWRAVCDELRLPRSAR